MKTRTIFIGIIFVSLLSTFIQPALAETGFDDVPIGHPNYTSITQLKSFGIIEGYADGTFRPDQEVNRVEALKIILLGAGIDVNESTADTEFSDTTADAWYIQYIKKADKLGIVEGYPDGTFKPAKTINLVEALKVVQLAFNIDVSQITITEDPYTDAYASQWYAPYVQYAKDKNLIETNAENKIYPDQSMTRAKLVELIYRLMFVINNEVEKYNPLEDPAVNDEETNGDSSTNTRELNVSIEKSKFIPDEMIVGVGWRIKWINNDSVTHTVTSDGALFNSDDLENGDTFEYVFKSTGTYSYHCEHHPSMTGTITVKPANQVPTI